MMVDKMKKIISSNKWVVVGLSCLLVILFIVIPIVRFTAFTPALPASESEPQAEEQKTNEESSDNSSADKVLSSYSTDEYDFVQYLMNNTWTTVSQTSSLSFSSSSFTKTNSEAVDFEILALNVNKNPCKTFDGLTYEKEYQVCLRTKDSDSIVSLIIGTNLQNTKVWKLESKIFGDDPYTITEIKKATVNPPSADIKKLINNDENGLNTTIQDYCSKNYPAVSQVQISPSAELDSSKNLVTLKASLNTKTTTQITILYHTDTKTFEVQK